MDYDFAQETRCAQGQLDRVQGGTTNTMKRSLDTSAQQAGQIGTTKIKTIIAVERGLALNMDGAKIDRDDHLICSTPLISI